MQTSSRFPLSARCWLAPAWLAIFAVAGCASAPPADTKAPAPSMTEAGPAPAAPASLPLSVEAGHSQKFARWVAEFSASARAAGIDEATLHSAFDNVRFIPRVIELDRAQPEFTRAVWDYLDSALSRAAHRARPGQAAATAAGCRRHRRALRRPGRDPRRDLGHGEQLRQLCGRHPDHRRPGDARFRGPARGVGARPVARGLENPAEPRHRPRADDRFVGRRDGPDAVPAVELPGLCGRCRWRWPARHLGQPARCDGFDRELPGQLRLAGRPAVGA